MKKTIASATVAASVVGGAAAGLLFVPGLASAQEDSGEVTPPAEGAPPAERGERLDGLAEQLGLTAAELHDALHEGKTLAAIATEQGIDIATVIDFMVEGATARIEEAVDSGRLTRERADERLSTLAEHITERVNSVNDRGRHGPGPGRSGGGFRADIADAAESVGLDVTGLRQAREEGKTLADVASEQGVDVQSLIDAIVTQRQANLAEAVADGRIDQDRADEIGADLTERVTAMVNGEFERPDRGHRGGRPS